MNNTELLSQDAHPVWLTNPVAGQSVGAHVLSSLHHRERERCDCRCWVSLPGGWSTLRSYSRGLRSWTLSSKVARCRCLQWLTELKSERSWGRGKFCSKTCALHQPEGEVFSSGVCMEHRGWLPATGRQSSCSGGGPNWRAAVSRWRWD